MRSLVHLNSIENTSKNLHFLSTISSISRSYFPLLWHLWQQKNNIAVRRRARTRVRDEENRYSLDLLSVLCKMRVKKNVLSLFPWFFTLWGLFDPYMYRDAFTLRIPNFLFYFHGYGQSNISIFYVPYKFLHRLCIPNRRATNAAFEGWGRNYRLLLIEPQSVIWCQRENEWRQEVISNDFHYLSDRNQRFYTNLSDILINIACRTAFPCY